MDDKVDNKLGLTSTNLIPNENICEHSKLWPQNSLLFSTTQILAKSYYTHTGHDLTLYLYLIQYLNTFT